MTEELWTVIEEAPRYEVSSIGRVRRVHDGYVLKARVNKQGYSEVTLVTNSGRVYRRVHRLVCAAFHGPAPADRPFACHNNDAPDDNRAENLVWGSRMSNADDALRNDRYLRGAQCGSSKYTEGQVKALLEDKAKTGASLDVLNQRHPMSRSQIHKILTGRYWSHIR